MKLNMWMIANKLRNYETDMHLDPEADAELNSVLPIYVSGCVRVSSQGRDVICEHDQEYIRIKELSLSDGYMLIQGIFDWYQDWLDRTNTAIMSNDFKSLAEECRSAFDNPIMLQDSNYCLLGMAGSSADEAYPPEWRYILNGGQSSVEGYEFMASALRHAEGIYQQNVRKFKGKAGSLMPFGGLHANIIFQERAFGKITVLERDRELNRGDICLLEFLTRRMAIYMAAISGRNQQYLDTEILEALVMGQKVPYEKISYFQSLLKGGRTGKFSLMAINYSKHDRKGDWRALLLLKNIVFYQYPRIVCKIIKDNLLILLYSDDPHTLAEQILKTLGDCGYEKDLIVGRSLEFYQLSESACFYEQAIYAQERSKPGAFTEFYGYASEYIMGSSGVRQFCAGEPSLRHMWNTEPTKRAYLETLRVYLEEERSSTRAANRLFIHKNTLTYRIKYLKENMKWDLNDYKIRNYLRLSFYILKKEK